MQNNILLSLLLLGFFNGILVAPGIVFLGRRNSHLKWNAIAVLLLSLTILREFIHVYGNEIGLPFTILPFLYFKLAVCGLVLMLHNMRNTKKKSPNYLLLVPGIVEFVLFGLLFTKLLHLPSSLADTLFIAVDCIGFFWLLDGYRQSDKKKDSPYFLPLFVLAFAFIFFTRVLQLMAILTQWENLYGFHFIFRMLGIGVVLYGLSIYLVIFYVKDRGGKKWMTSGKPLPESEATSLLEQIKEDGLYLDRELSLERLAVSFGLDSKTLSATIKFHKKTSFNDYVNTLRLDHFMECLYRNEQQRYSLMGLAEKSGFGSKTTFNRVFRRKYQMAPSTYLAKYM